MVGFEIVMSWLAALPILLLLGLILVARRPLLQAAPLSLLAAATVAMVFWDLSFSRLLGALLKGVGLGFDVILIVFGAVFFLKYIEEIGILKSIEAYMQLLSPDRRIQAILIAWLFGSFIEGTAGFGTPAAIVAPLLFSIGFPLLCSVVIALLANSTAVAFGAVGTPLRIGLADFDTMAISLKAAEINLATGVLVPLLIVAIVVRQASDGKRWSYFREAIPWALWAGFSFVGFAYLFAHFGPELPSLLGALCAMIVVGASLKYKFLVPRRVFVFKNVTKQIFEMPKHSVLQTVSPYILLVVLMVLSKFLLQSLIFDVSLPGKLFHRVNLFNPGFAFIISILLMVLFSKRAMSEMKRPLSVALASLLKPALSIFAIVAFVQVLMSTEGIAGAGSGMLTNLISAFSSDQIVPYFSAVIGAFGSFVAGSATVSNLLFGPLQAALVVGEGAELVFVLALQLVGAAIGNMLALPNILAVGATVKASGREAEIMKMLAWPFVIYLLVVSSYALWLAY